MKKLFVSFWRRNLGFLRVGIITNLEYRFNFIADAILQPVLTTLIEVLLWLALFQSTQKQLIAGFPQESYLAYALWAAFIARITSNWMYEFRMIEEIDTGSINGLLVRPVTFFEYYLSQFMGYKMITSAFSLCIPIAAEFFLNSPAMLLRLPLALALVFYYLILVYVISVCVASFAFFFNRVHSFTTAKNLLLWLLSGELFPLDLVPDPWKTYLLSMPFSSAVYVPAGYLTGRIGLDGVIRGFVTVSIGLVVFGTVAHLLWTAGMKRYAGTGA